MRLSLREWRRGLTGETLARNTLWVAGGQILRVGVQAVYVVLIARALGSREYGAYVGVLALVAIAAPFATLGTGNLLIMHVARQPDTFRRQWGKALVTTLVTGILLSGLVTGVGRLWLPGTIPVWLVVAIGAADLVFVRLVDISAQAYLAHQRMSRTALLQLFLSPLRLIAAVLLSVSASTPSAMQWGALYLVTAVIGAVVAVTLVGRELGKPSVDLPALGSELGAGTLFSVSHSAQTVTNDLDKAMLARLGTLEATGVYAAAYRLVDVAFVPVGSLLVATYARFFQHGAQGLRATASLARRFTTIAAGYGLVAAVGLFLLAPLLPVLLGQEYREAVAAVRWLSLLPLLKAVHYFGADALTGAGYQGVRTVIQIGIAGVNVVLNLWLIPLYSWHGAAVATLVSDGLMILLIWTSVWVLASRGDPLQSGGKSSSIVGVESGR